jgi:hypothetical protein
MEGCLIRIIRPSGESTPKKRKQTQQELGSNIKVGCVCDAPSSPSLFLVPVEAEGFATGGLKLFQYHGWL